MEIANLKVETYLAKKKTHPERALIVRYFRIESRNKK